MSEHIVKFVRNFRNLGVYSINSPHAIYQTLTQCRGLQAKLHFFSRFLCLLLPRRDLNTKKTKSKFVPKASESHQNFDTLNVGYWPHYGTTSETYINKLKLD